MLPKSFQRMGRKGIGGKSSFQGVQSWDLVDGVDAALERKQRRRREDWVNNYPKIRKNVDEGILKVNLRWIF